MLKLKLSYRLLFLFFLLPNCGSRCDLFIFLEDWPLVVINKVQFQLKFQKYISFYKNYVILKCTRSANIDFDFIWQFNDARYQHESMTKTSKNSIADIVGSLRNNQSNFQLEVNEYLPTLNCKTKNMYEALQHAIATNSPPITTTTETLTIPRNQLKSSTLDVDGKVCANSRCAQRYHKCAKKENVYSESAIKGEM